MNCANHPDRERVAFCQNCGKPVCSECARVVGSAVFCEPCLAARLAGTGSVVGGAAAGGYGVMPEGVPAEPYGAVAPVAPGSPNPGLAALLGFIPGVGAFYNGQYAKGIVHLIVFAVLTTLADDNKLFILFVFGWEFYQVIEAHHTARARRDGTPLPNPFGLNDIGERLGFGRSWPANGPGAPYAGGPAGTGATAYEAAPAAGAEPVAPVGGYAAGQPGYASVPRPTGWGAPADSYAYVPPPIPTVPPVPPAYSAASRVPTGAIVLIGLGVLFLIGNSGIFRGFPIHRLIPFLLIGFGVWLFVRKMLETGPGLSDDGTAGYRLRLFRAMRGAIWVVLVGVLFLLDSFHILSWGRSWPLFIIVGGVMTFLERTAYSGVVAPYPYAAPAAAAAAPRPAAVESTSIVPTITRDQEEK